MINENINSKQVWLVTNEAEGLGLTLIRALRQAGHAVAVIVRKPSSCLLQAAGADLSGDLLILQADCRHERSLQTSISKILEHYGTIDVVVNSAEDNGNDVDMFGPLNVIRRVMPHLRAKQGGMIINVASVACDEEGSRHWGARIAVAGLTERLALEAAPLGIQSVAVYPDRQGAAALLMRVAADPHPPLHLFVHGHGDPFQGQLSAYAQQVEAS